MAELSYDLTVIGSGPGGYVAAIRASQLGLSVAIIEKDKPGGVCLNVGCIPSKALIHQAEIFESGKKLAEMGVSIDWKSFDYSKVHQKSRDAAQTLSRGVQFLLKKNNVAYMQGVGHIKDSTHVEVTKDDNSVVTLTSKYILIATGSRPHEIPGFAFDESKVLSSTGMLAMTTLPRSLLILGAGVIGMEFAHIMHSFGVKVTMIELLPRILNGADDEMGVLMRKHYEKKGIEILTGCKALDMKKSANGVQVTVEHADTQKKQTLEGEKLLVSVGRAPNSDGLNLEALGVKCERGFIRVSSYYRTTVSNIYAVGDVIATPQLAHVAFKEGEVAAEHMGGRSPERKLFPTELYPFAVYTEPELAWFGPTEQQLKESGKAYKVSRFPYRGAGKSVAVDAANGMVKVCFNPNTDEILSAHIFGKNATELIHELLLAKQAELLPEDIADVVHAHPTLSEVILEVSRAAKGWAIHA